MIGPPGRFVLRLPAGIEAGVHANIGELRQIDGQRRVELELAALVELHERHAGHRLGHGENLHDGVARHRLVVFAVGQPESAEVGFPAVLVHQRRNADGIPAVDDALERAVDGGRVDEGWERWSGGNRGRGRRGRRGFRGIGGDG